MWIYVRTEGPGDVLESSSALALRAGQDVRTVTIRRLLVYSVLPSGVGSNPASASERCWYKSVDLGFGPRRRKTND